MKHKQARHYTRSGKLLRHLRLQASLTQRDVANALEYSSAQFISNFENGLAAPPTWKLHVLRKVMKINGEHWIHLLNTIAADEKLLFLLIANTGKK